MQQTGDPSGGFLRREECSNWHKGLQLTPLELFNTNRHTLWFSQKAQCGSPPTAVDFWGQTFFYCPTLARKHETIFHFLWIQIVGSLLWGIGCLFVCWSFKRFDWSKLLGSSREHMIFLLELEILFDANCWDLPVRYGEIFSLNFRVLGICRP